MKTRNPSAIGQDCPRSADFRNRIDSVWRWGHSPLMNHSLRRDLAHDLILPTALFVVLGAMAWAVRGCSGFGAMNGCIFAGVTWGAAWWFVARNSSGGQPRPYHSGW